jgi:hypothetical protein
LDPLVGDVAAGVRGVRPGFAVFPDTDALDAGFDPEAAGDEGGATALEGATARFALGADGADGAVGVGGTGAATLDGAAAIGGATGVAVRSPIQAAATPSTPSAAMLRTPARRRPEVGATFDGCVAPHAFPVACAGETGGASATGAAPAAPPVAAVGGLAAE